jgi:hypothetical protein
VIKACWGSTEVLTSAQATCDTRRGQTLSGRPLDYDPEALRHSVDCFTFAYGRALDVQALSEQAWAAATRLQLDVGDIDTRLAGLGQSPKNECAVALLPLADRHIGAVITALRKIADFVPVQ